MSSKILELKDLIDMDSPPNVEDLIRLPSGEVKRFGDCNVRHITEMIIELQVEIFQKELEAL